MAAAVPQMILSSHNDVGCSKRPAPNIMAVMRPRDGYCVWLGPWSIAESGSGKATWRFRPWIICLLDRCCRRLSSEQNSISLHQISCICLQIVTEPVDGWHSSREDGDRNISLFAFFLFVVVLAFVCFWGIRATCSSDWPWTHKKSTCFCFPSARITELNYLSQMDIKFWRCHRVVSRYQWPWNMYAHK